MKKIISGALILVLIANITLFALSRINSIIFWLIIALAGLIAYKIIPLIKDKTSKK